MNERQEFDVYSQFYQSKDPATYFEFGGTFISGEMLIVHWNIMRIAQSFRTM